MAAFVNWRQERVLDHFYIYYIPQVMKPFRRCHAKLRFFLFFMLTKRTHRLIYHSEFSIRIYTKFHKNTLQTHENMGLQTCKFYKEMYCRGQPPGTV